MIDALHLINTRRIKRQVLDGTHNASCKDARLPRTQEYDDKKWPPKRRHDIHKGANRARDRGRRGTPSVGGKCETVATAFAMTMSYHPPWQRFATAFLVFAAVVGGSEAAECTGAGGPDKIQLSAGYSKANLPDKPEDVNLTFRITDITDIDAMSNVSWFVF